MKAGYWICLIVWLGLVLLAAGVLIRGYQTAIPDEIGLDFRERDLSAGLPALLAFIVPMFSVAFLPSWRGVVGCIAQWAITVLAAVGANAYASHIEFERTPPCWGIHSVDPGSGVGCPKGMKEDFTPDQIKAWYAEQKVSE